MGFGSYVSRRSLFICHFLVWLLSGYSDGVKGWCGDIGVTKHTGWKAVRLKGRRLPAKTTEMFDGRAT